MILCSRDLDKLNSGSIIMNGPEDNRTYFIKDIYYRWLVCDEDGNTFSTYKTWNRAYDSDQIHFPVWRIK